MTKTIQDCQCDATRLHGMLTGIELLDAERGSSLEHSNAIAALICIAVELASTLADDLDAVKA